MNIHALHQSQNPQCEYCHYGDNNKRHRHYAPHETYLMVFPSSHFSLVVIVCYIHQAY